MELLMYPKTDYLLNTSLESLHAESREWLREIDFWKDEMAFFYNLIHEKSKGKAFPQAEAAAFERELLEVNTNKLDSLRNQVRSHEQALSTLFTATVLQEEEKYRETHRKLLQEMYDCHLVIRNFKKNIFSYIQKFEVRN